MLNGCQVNINENYILRLFKGKRGTNFGLQRTETIKDIIQLLPVERFQTHTFIQSILNFGEYHVLTSAHVFDLSSNGVTGFSTTNHSIHLSSAI